MTSARERTPERDRERARRPDSRQIEAMKDIGKFRLVNLDDLAEYRYGSDSKSMRGDLTALAAQGTALVEIHRVIDRKTDERIEVGVLTAKGKSYLQSLHVSQAVYDGQKLFDGFVRRREIFHDARIYPAYQDAAREIERAGGVIDRVVLDHEIKGIKARLTNKRHPLEGATREMGNENSALTPAQQRAIAKELNLRVTSVERRGVTQQKILIPDLRIEYRDRNGKAQIRDLEIVTSSYRAAERRAKAAAGFSMSGSSGRIAQPGAKVWDVRAWG